MDEHYMKKDLKERGWTTTLIERFLGTPDETATNMHYKSGPPICLYDRERVHTVERSTEFVLAKQKTDKTRLAARKAVATKRAKTERKVAEIEITVPVMDMETLTRRAVDHYNEIRNRESWSARMDSEEAFLDRIRVNYPAIR